MSPLSDHSRIMAVINPPFALGPNYGAYYWSAILCTAFWAITCVQLYLYFLKYNKDSRVFKLMALSAWFLDTVHVVLIIEGVYYYLVTNFGDFDSFIGVEWPMLIEFVFQIIASMLTQGFFVWRLMKVLKSRKWIPLVGWLPLALLQVGFGLVFLVQGMQTPTIITLTSPMFHVFTITYLVTTCIADLGLSFALTYSLVAWKSEVHFQGSSLALKRLIMISLNNGIWTAAFALLDMILYLIFPTTSLYLIFDFAMCSLYTNTLLANLNARDFVASGLQTVVSVPSEPYGEGSTAYSMGMLHQPLSNTSASNYENDQKKIQVGVVQISHII